MSAWCWASFTLDIAETNELIVSYIGYQSQKIEVREGKDMLIVLKEDTQLLDEVVVVGYTTVKKSSITGAIYDYHECGADGNAFPVLEQGAVCAARLDLQDGNIRLKVIDTEGKVLKDIVIRAGK